MEFWKEVIAKSPHLEEAVRDVRQAAADISAHEILDGEDFPHPYIDFVAEWVGEWISSSYTNEEEDWSDLCCVFYEFKGCLDLSSHNDEWNKFWLSELGDE